MTGMTLIGSLSMAGPAQADPAPMLFAVNKPPQLGDFKPGAPAQKITFTVTDAGEAPNTTLTAAMTMAPADDFTISVDGCTSTGPASCSFQIPQNSTANITFTVQENANVTDIPQGASAGFLMTVKIADAANSDTLTGNGQIYGMPKPVVVNGAVYDSGTGKVVPGALVKLIDDTNAVFTMTTAADGKFSFTSTATRPIVGELALGASKTNYKTVPMTLAVGTPTTGLHLNLDPIAVASASPSITATPTDPVSTPPVGAGVEAQTTNAAAAGSGGSGMKLILIGGIVLVLGGAGAIAYMMLWRKKDDAGGAPARSGGGGGDPYPSRSGGRGLDRTTVAPSLGDAPTMMHRPIVDEYADPYAAPRANPAPRPGPGPAGPRQGGGYAPTQPAYGQPAYSPPAPTYGQPGYEQGGGYQQQGYGANHESNGYQQANGYQQPNSYPPANGYQQGGYQEPAQPTTPRRPAADPYAAYPPAQPGYAADPTTFGAYPGSPAAPGGYQQGAGYQTETGYAPTHNAGYQPSGPTYPPADQGYGSQPAGQQYGGNYQQSAPPAQNGYQQGGYQQGGQQQSGYQQGGQQQGGHHQAQQGGYQQGGYQQPPAQQYNDEPYGQPAAQGYPPQAGGGYRGGYTPPDQRGAVDWLDD
jgi:hypothetical protein